MSLQPNIYIKSNNVMHTWYANNIIPISLSNCNHYSKLKVNNFLSA